MNTRRFVSHLIARFYGRLLGNTLLLVAENFVAVVALLAVAPIVDVFMYPGNPESPITRRIASALASLGVPATLGAFFAVFLLLQLAKNGLMIVTRYSILHTKYAVLRDLMVGTFEDFFNARWSFFSGNKQGTILNTFMHEITVIGHAFGAVALFATGIVQIAFYIAVPFYLSWQVTTISLATALVLAGPFLLLGKVSYRLGRLNTSTANEMSGVIQESLSLAKIVLGFGNQRRGLRDLQRAFDGHRRVTVKSQTLNVTGPMMYEPFGMIVLVVAIVAAQQFSVPLSEMAVLLWALRNGIPVIGLVMMQRNALAGFTPSYEQLEALRQKARAVAQTSGAAPFPGFQRDIVVDGVTLAYPGQGPVLRDVSLRVPKGRMIAIVGESGAGKSTLIDLIVGLEKPTGGRILCDGISLEQFDMTSYRRRIGYVPQDSALFNLSIRDNLRWANERATDDEIVEACVRANAAEFIERFPDGYDTVVGDRGVRLSGGQCQRIALARAILRKPDLLILDEATSALDTQSERLIQEAIDAIARETTVVVIAHRLSTIVHADYVYVLHRGSVVEEGTYQELMARDGHFSRMTQLQVLEGAGRTS